MIGRSPIAKLRLFLWQRFSHWYGPTTGQYDRAPIERVTFVLWHMPPERWRRIYNESGDVFVTSLPNAVPVSLRRWHLAPEAVAELTNPTGDGGSLYVLDIGDREHWFRVNPPILWNVLGRYEGCSRIMQLYDRVSGSAAVATSGEPPRD